MDSLFCQQQAVAHAWKKLTLISSKFTRIVLSSCLLLLTLNNLWLHRLDQAPNASVGTVVTVLGSNNTSTSALATTPNPETSFLPIHIENRTRKIVFVHVGKAAGESIRQVLATGCHVMRNAKRRENCLADLPSSKLSDQVVGYFHCFSIKPKKIVQEATSFLYNLRHPVDRTLSWYRYVHPDNCHPAIDRGSPACLAKSEATRDNETSFANQFFVECFPTFSAWADTIAGTASSTNETSVCETLARQAIAGDLDWTKHHLASHMVANLEHYTNLTIKQFPQTEVFVVRTEFLWSDMKQLDILLGGTGDFGKKDGTRFTHGSEHSVWPNSPSPHHVFTMCCALHRELEIYKDILFEAVNLPLEIKTETWNAAMETCGSKSWDSFVRDCAGKKSVG